MDAITYAKGSLEQSMSLLAVTADGMNASQYNLDPTGTCNPVAKNHVHAWSALDFFILASAAGGQMKWPAVAQAQGLSSNPLEIWKYEGNVDLDAIKAYGEDVRQAVLAYLSTLSDADLDRELKTPFGTQTLAWVLQLMTAHLAGHAGDIAAVKGVQGLKGLPY